MRFENLNSSRFSQILTEINSSDLKSHIHIMLQPGVWQGSVAGECGRGAWQGSVAGERGRGAWQGSVAGERGRGAWQGSVAGERGRGAWQGSVAGERGRGAWQGSVAGERGRGAWQGSVAGERGRGAWQGSVAGERGRGAWQGSVAGERGRVVWGTHVEIIAASTYFQVPIYFFRTPSSMLKWEVFKPLGPSCEFSYQEYPEVDTAAEDMTCHYDSITLKSDEVSLVRPTLQYSYTDCRNYIILFCCCCVCFLLHFVLSYVVCML